MNKIITLDELVVRDGKQDVREWILWMCEASIKAHKIERGWDGESVEGGPVLAFVNNGRWLGRCKVCNNPIYVSWRTPVLYCMECGNGGSRSAWPVEFPANREQVEAALLKREVVANARKFIRNDVEQALNSSPKVPGLGRNWRPGITVEQLERENGEGVPSPQPSPEGRGGRRRK